jgi:hypothetical protein
MLMTYINSYCGVWNKAVGFNKKKGTTTTRKKCKLRSVIGAGAGIFGLNELDVSGIAWLARVTHMTIKKLDPFCFFMNSTICGGEIFCPIIVAFRLTLVPTGSSLSRRLSNSTICKD